MKVEAITYPSKNNKIRIICHLFYLNYAKIILKNSQKKLEKTKKLFLFKTI